VSQHIRPEGAEESPGIGFLSSAQESPSPRRGEKEGKNPDPFSLIRFPRVPRRAAARRAVRNPWYDCVSIHPPRRGGGIAGHRRPFVGPRISFAPPGRKRGKKTPTPFPSSAFHGFRVGPVCGRAAPPAARTRRPVRGYHSYGACHGRTLPPPQGSVRQ